jgi:phosphate transport system substrate-binding protein
MKRFFFIAVSVAALTGCGNYHRNDYRDNTPTSGWLKVYYDEGLELHVINHAYTFESQYDRAHIKPVRSVDDEAVRALLNDSCEAIVISRQFSENEKRLFASKQYTPYPIPVAKSGVAVIAAETSPWSTVTVNEIRDLLGSGKAPRNFPGGVVAMLDRNNSSVVHYLKDSVLGGGDFSGICAAAASTTDCISYVSTHPNAIGFIDFAWLSDRDDSLYKAFEGKIKFVGVSNGGRAGYPSQSSFKTGTYPFTRTVFVVRKTGEFTLAKGFETWVAGPKGQLTFLKQGLLPTRQAERNVEVKFEPM